MAIAKARAEIPGLHTRTFKNGDIATVRREIIKERAAAAKVLEPVMYPPTVPPVLTNPIKVRMPGSVVMERREVVAEKIVEEPAAAEVSVEAEKVGAKGEPEKGTPTWYTEDFKAALALLRVEMLRASITEITNLNAGGFEFERVEIVRGRL